MIYLLQATFKALGENTIPNNHWIISLHELVITRLINDKNTLGKITQTFQ
jgi:hypothetical protein